MWHPGASATRTGGLKFTAAAAADPDALRYVGAVAFHSWGGAEPKTYAAWADLADRLKLPLLVTEMGVDANWSGRPTELPGYWLRDLRQYQELLGLILSRLVDEPIEFRLLGLH